MANDDDGFELIDKSEVLPDAQPSMGRAEREPVVLHDTQVHILLRGTPLQQT